MGYGGRAIARWHTSGRGLCTGRAWRTELCACVRVYTNGKEKSGERRMEGKRRHITQMRETDEARQGFLSRRVFLALSLSLLVRHSHILAATPRRARTSRIVSWHRDRFISHFYPCTCITLYFGKTFAKYPSVLARNYFRILLISVVSLFLTTTVRKGVSSLHAANREVEKGHRVRALQNWIVKVDIKLSGIPRCHSLVPTAPCHSKICARRK